MTDDVVVRVAKLPDSVKGFVTPSPDGVMNVYLNEKLTQEQQQETLTHELGHVERAEVGNGRPLEEVERAPARLVFVPIISSI